MKRILFTTVSLGVLGLMSPAFGRRPSDEGRGGRDAGVRLVRLLCRRVRRRRFWQSQLNNGTPNGFANYLITYDSTAYWRRRGRLQRAVGGYRGRVEAGGFWSGIKGSDLSQLTQASCRLPPSTPPALSGRTFLARGGYTIDRLMLFSSTGGWPMRSSPYHTPWDSPSISTTSPQRPGCRRRHRLRDHQ